MMDHRSHRHKRSGFAALGVLVLLFLTTGITAAKSSANWVTITGPGLTGEVTVTDPVLLASVGPKRITGTPSGPLSHRPVPICHIHARTFPTRLSSSVSNSRCHRIPVQPTS